jgi:hypothetical protein
VVAVLPFNRPFSTKVNTPVQTLDKSVPSR